MRAEGIVSDKRFTLHQRKMDFFRPVTVCRKSNNAAEKQFRLKLSLEWKWK